MHLGRYVYVYVIARSRMLGGRWCIWPEAKCMVKHSKWFWI